jgi:hypothetical protein
MPPLAHLYPITMCDHEHSHVIGLFCRILYNTITRSMQAIRFNKPRIQTCRFSRVRRKTTGITELYQSTIEPILTYAIEAWYPSQVVLKNSIARVKKFAARLATNHFRLSTHYTSLLDDLNWIPLSQLAMEKPAVLAHHYANGRR